MTEEDRAWELYTNGMKSKWVSNRVKDRNDFKDCSEYDEYMNMSHLENEQITKKLSKVYNENLEEFLQPELEKYKNLKVIIDNKKKI